MNAQASTGDRTRSHAALTLGLWGGSLAWLAHLLLAYLIAEFGCLSRLGSLRVLGITGVAWMVLAASALTLAVAAGAAILAVRCQRRLREELPGESRETERFLARVGLVASGLFVFIILVETVPIFFFLREC